MYIYIYKYKYIIFNKKTFKILLHIFRFFTRKICKKSKYKQILNISTYRNISTSKTNPSRSIQEDKSK